MDNNLTLWDGIRTNGTKCYTHFPVDGIKQFHNRGRGMKNSVGTHETRHLLLSWEFVLWFLSRLIIILIFYIMCLFGLTCVGTPTKHFNSSKFPVDGAIERLGTSTSTWLITGSTIFLVLDTCSMTALLSVINRFLRVSLEHHYEGLFSKLMSPEISRVTSNFYHQFLSLTWWI